MNSADNRSRLAAHLPLVLFVFALLVAMYGYGYLSARKHLPPDGMIRTAIETVQDLSRYWKNDLEIEPTRHLVEASPGRKPFVSYHADRLMPGLRFVSGLTGHRHAMNGAQLFTADGRELHFWPIDYAQLDPDGPDPENVMLHGITVLRDGSIVVNFDEGQVLARLDACGRIIWNRHGWYHHAVTSSHDGTLWALNWDDDSDVLDQIDVADGSLLQRISLMRDVILAHGRAGKFLSKFPESEHGLVTPVDPFHTNDIEVLSPALAAAFPEFSPGDLLISLRSVNLVAVIDSNSHDVLWSRIGPWYRQHDPDFLPDGRISVYDNHMGFGASRILAVDPRTDQVDTLYEGSDLHPFYSWRRGQQQTLPNGNLLITESERGRVFEVDRKGDLLWEYQNIYDDSRNGVVTDAEWLPENYFAAGALQCSAQNTD